MGCSAWALAEPPAPGPLPAGTRLHAPGTAPACWCSSGAPTSGLGAHWAQCHPLLRMCFSQLGCKSQSLLFQHQLVHFWSSVSQGLNLSLLQLQNVAVQLPADVQMCSHQEPRVPANLKLTLCFCPPASIPLCQPVPGLLRFWRMN